jgi:hypothetical protein
MKNLFHKIRKFLLFCAVNLIIVAVVFILFEGLASVILLLEAMTNTPPLAERSHTRYDEQLGWVNLPNVYIEDMYGPGLYLKTNAQGFRNDEDFSVAAPNHQVRLICSGDSFTLGYGVDNRQTWCQRLADFNPQWQTVNMGQGGYGVDQAYLWYKRDGVQLDHDIHLFTFITTDFDRMQQDSFLGYGKPLLDLQDNQLVIKNLPVPKRAFYVPWLTQNSQAIKELRSVRLLSQLFRGAAQAATPNTQPTQLSKTEIVAIKILADLRRLNDSKGSILVLVYLPTLGDYAQPYPAVTERWRENINRAAQETDIIFIDLIPDFRALPPAQVQELFIPEGEIDFPGAAGHYSVQGNEYIAQKLNERLLSFTPISNRLAEKSR